MKFFLCFLLTTLTLLSMDDEPSHSKHTNPDLYCMRILEKIEWLIDEMNREITEFKDPTSYKQRMDTLELRLERCYKKLNTHGDR